MTHPLQMMYFDSMELWLVAIESFVKSGVTFEARQRGVDPSYTIELTGGY